MLSEKLVVREEGVIEGLGLVARETISPGEILWQPDPKYKLLRLDELQLYYQSGGGDHYSQVDKNLYARNSEEEWCWNHSCEPNCAVSGHLLVALRGIGVGEEVSYDYGLIEPGRAFQVWCQCGSSSCRKLILNIDYLNQPLIESAGESVRDFVRELSNSASTLDRLRYQVFRNTLLIKRQLIPNVKIPAGIRQTFLRLFTN